MEEINNNGGEVKGNADEILNVGRREPKKRHK